MSEPIKLLLAEDHELFRVGLKIALERVGLFDITDARDGQDAVEKTHEIKPDVVLMDLKMPIKDGISATQEIKSNVPSTKVLILTASSVTDEIFAAFAAGADGYCLKSVKVEQLVLAIKSVSEGAAWLDPAIADLLLRAQLYGTPKKANCDIMVLGFGLTPREKEVLSLLVEGLSNSQIAKTLSVSSETVKTHVRNIMGKLLVSDRTQAAVKAIREGLL